jgi:hypothetical protein
VTAAAAVVLVLGFVLHAVLVGPESAEKQIGDQVYENCVDFRDAFRAMCANRGGVLHGDAAA